MSTIEQNFYRELLSKFPYERNAKQGIFFRKITDFILDKENKSIFMLKGYAGTGKTSVVSALINPDLLLEIKY